MSKIDFDEIDSTWLENELIKNYKVPNIKKVLIDKKTKKRKYFKIIVSSKDRKVLFDELIKVLKKSFKNVVHDKSKSKSSVGHLIIDFGNNKKIILMLKPERSSKTGIQRHLFDGDHAAEQYVMFLIPLVFDVGHTIKSAENLFQIFSKKGIEKTLKKFTNIEGLEKVSNTSFKNFDKIIQSNQINVEEINIIDYYLPQVNEIYNKFNVYYSNPKEIVWGGDLFNNIRRLGKNASGIKLKEDKWNPSDFYIVRDLSEFNKISKSDDETVRLTINSTFATIKNLKDKNKIIGISLKSGHIDSMGDLIQASVNGKIKGVLKYSKFDSQMESKEILKDVKLAKSKLEKFGKWVNESGKSFFNNDKLILKYIEKNKTVIEKMSPIFDFINAGESWEIFLKNDGEQLKGKIAEAFSLSKNSCPYFKSIGPKIMFVDRNFIKNVKIGDLQINFGYKNGSVISPKNSKISFTVTTDDDEKQYPFVFRNFNGLRSLKSTSFEIGKPSKLEQIIKEKIDSNLESSFILQIKDKQYLELSQKKKKKSGGKMPKKFYHVSPHKFKHGKILLPASQHSGKRGYGSSWDDDYLYLNGTFIPHITMITKILNDDKTWFVYEVEPEGKIIWSDIENEYLVKKAKIVKNIGNAKSIITNRQYKLKNRKKKGLPTDPRGFDSVPANSHSPYQASKHLDDSIDWNQVKKNILEMKHIWEISKKGEKFIENLFNKEIIIQQKLDGSTFNIEWDGKKLHYFGRNNKKIGHRTRASITLYEPIIEHLEKQNLSLLPKTIITGEYFPKGLKPLIPIKIYPKNSWIIFSASHTNSINELNKIANILNVEGPPTIFKGRLNATQKNEIMNFIYMNEEERISRFETQSFAKFILELINPSFKFKINDEVLQGVVFDFQDESPMQLKMIDSLFISKIKSKKSEDDEKSYQYIIKDITLEFLNSHFEELKTMTAFYLNEDDHEVAFINLINDFLINNLKDLSQYKKRVINFKSRPGDLGKLFELNPKYVDPKLMQIVEKEFWIGDIFNLIIGHFYSPKRRAAGVFNTQDLERINKIVNIIQYNLQTKN